MVGKKRSIHHVENNAEEILSVPPGFVSLTSLTLKKIVTSREGSVEQECKPIGVPLINSDIEKFKTSLIQRPWISHGQFIHNPQQDGTEQTEVNTKDPISACLPKGVIRGCANCHDCVKVTARWHPEESSLPAFKDAPVFQPTEEEFKDTLKYITSIRRRAEKYGICRIIPPPSWIPPCPLEDKKTETSKFSTHVQKINGLQNLYFKRKPSRLHKKIETKVPEDAASMELGSCNEDVGDSEEAKFIPIISEFEKGPEFTLKSFKKYADDFKSQYFCENDKVIDPDISMTAGKDQRELLISRIEGEYWRIVENPSEEIEVLFCTDMAGQNLGSRFPIAGSSTKDMAKYTKYTRSGWNLNNIQNLSGSLLPFGCYNSSAILVPQMFIGMCFASQYWRNEDHHLYSLSYMHLGSPKVWYGIPGRYSFKYVEVVKKLFPQLSKHPKFFHELVALVSPSKLISEGIPVYRCLQNPFEFVVTFPGAYHSEFSCGFNCSESVCFAPFDWLPHGQNIVEVYAGYCSKTSISHDKLLLGAAIEAVGALWESFAIKNDSSNNHPWKTVCGKDGILTRLLKSRVKDEDIRRKHLCNTSMSIELDEFDVATERECTICLYDLYLSAVACSCSPNRYSCLRHAKQICTCAWGARHFFFRYEIRELNLLVEALEGNLKALHSWAKRKAHPLQLNHAETGPRVLGERKNPDTICSEISGGSSYGTNSMANNKKLVWVRSECQGRQAYINGYTRLRVLDDIKEILQRISVDCVRDFERTCFGHFLRWDTERNSCKGFLHVLMSREVRGPDTPMDEKWFLIGRDHHLCRFSRREFALVTGLRFGDSDFIPAILHHPHQDGVFWRVCVGQPRITVADLRRRFKAGEFVASREDTMKIAKILLLYSILLGVDPRTTSVDSWVWDLVDQEERWESFPWGKISYLTLLNKMNQLPSSMPDPVGNRPPTYHFYGFSLALMIWAFEAIPSTGDYAGYLLSDDHDVCPRFLKWSTMIPEDDVSTKLDEEGLVCFENLTPSTGETRQPFWQFIDQDLSKGVQLPMRTRGRPRRSTDVLSIGVTADVDVSGPSVGETERPTRALRSTRTTRTIAEFSVDKPSSLTGSRSEYISCSDAADRRGRRG